MKTIKRIIQAYKENTSSIPYKTVFLKTGIVCNHYKNGSVKVI